MIVGFTGTRNGMTPEQKETVKYALTKWKSEEIEVIGLHGDCIGADVDFHFICREIGLHVLKRPSIWDSTVAGTDAERIALSKRPYERNRDIANQADRMIACPPNFEKIEHSGTWYTLEYASKLGKRVTIVFPDGKTEVRNP